MKNISAYLVAVWLLISAWSPVQAEDQSEGQAMFSSWEMSGYAELEWRAFPEPPAYDRQFTGSDFSLALEPEWVWEPDSGNGLARIQPFFRYDVEDDERTHFDLREAYWQTSAGNWDFKLGVGKVFWGVTESRHLVDTINQTDTIEDIDEESKLGQPMVQATWLSDSMGVLDFFYLPYFRERTFPGKKGRLRFDPPFRLNHAVYESDLEQWHPDFALRWSKIVGAFDVGLHYFYGTSRDPIPLWGLNSSGDTTLTPFYPIMHQVGLDLQWTTDAWLWKLEAIGRQGTGQHFESMVGGFEYTWYGIFSSDADLGILAEYHFDSRWDQALTPFNHDVFGGLRWSLNDPADTSLLSGAFWDHEHQATSLRVEFQRRLGERFTTAIQGQWFAKTYLEDFGYAFRNDHFVTVELRRWF